MLIGIVSFMFGVIVGFTLAAVVSAGKCDECERRDDK